MTAADGPTAFLFFARKPDLVLLDVVMPGMDGWTVCRRIREMTDLSVLMLTAPGQVAERVKGLDLGADDYLIQPVAPEELRTRVRAALRRSQARPAEAPVPLAVPLRSGRLERTCR